MCGICGCSDKAASHLEHSHSPDLAHSHSHEHHTTIQIEQDILAKNNAFAKANRTYFQKKQILALNIMSSPGAGKTTLLTKSIVNLKSQQSFFVVVGDQQTDRDAQRISAAGVPALQINTGKGCHLDAHDISHALEKIAIPSQTILMIENVGNLVCPALFDLGENYRVVILSVTEGDDKPLKYPHMFHAADLVLITKIDLLPYVDFDVNRCNQYIKQINPNVEIQALSTTSGENLSAWQEWLCKHSLHRLQDNELKSPDKFKV